MFSLIITTIAIALVAVLAVATLYYGGATMSQGTVKAQAAQYVSEGQQISGAVIAYYADHTQYPTDLTDLVAEGYLSDIPVGVVAQTNTSVAVALAGAATGWTTPTSGQPTYALAAPVSDTVCEAINQTTLGTNGIALQAYNAYSTQCYFSVTSSANQVVVTLVGNGSTLTEALPTVDVAPPQLLPPWAGGSDSGWKVAPRVPSSSFAPPSSGSGSSATNSTVYTLYSMFGALDTTGNDSAGDGAGALYLCASGATSSSLNAQSTLAIGGVMVPVTWAGAGGGRACIGTSSAPAHAAGTVPVTTQNSDGSTGTGTILYVDVFSAPPQLSALSPSHGAADGTTQVTITGSNFVAGTVVQVNGGMPLSTTFVDSQHIAVTIPSSFSLGIQGPSGVVTILASNPTSALSSGGLTYTVDWAVAPSIGSFSPTKGSYAASTLVTITGSGFTPGMVISDSNSGVAMATTYIDAQHATVTVDQASQYGISWVLTAPADTFGVNFSVSNPGSNSSVDSTQFSFDYAALPSPLFDPNTPFYSLTPTLSPTFDGVGFEAGIGMLLNPIHLNIAGLDKLLNPGNPPSGTVTLLGTDSLTTGMPTTDPANLQGYLTNITSTGADLLIGVYYQGTWSDIQVDFSATDRVTGQYRTIVSQRVNAN